jgi:hypothetical protein
LLLLLQVLLQGRLLLHRRLLLLLLRGFCRITYAAVAVFTCGSSGSCLHYCCPTLLHMLLLLY